MPRTARSQRWSWAALGPLWYRGYFPGQADFTAATAQDVDLTLEAFGARRILVGHTIVPTVTPLYGGKVIAVQVQPRQDDAGKASFESLLIGADIPGGPSRWRAAALGRFAAGTAPSQCGRRLVAGRWRSTRTREPSSSAAQWPCVRELRDLDLFRNDQHPGGRADLWIEESCGTRCAVGLRRKVDDRINASRRHPVGRRLRAEASGLAQAISRRVVRTSLAIMASNLSTRLRPCRGRRAIAQAATWRISSSKRRENLDDGIEAGTVLEQLRLPCQVRRRPASVAASGTWFLLQLLERAGDSATQP